MTTPKETVWEIEPHTCAKHEILRRYLGAWFPILGTTNRQIIYIDGFCGPGRYKNGEVGSPIVALKEANQHKSRLSDKRITFLFVDERPDRIAHLVTELQAYKFPVNFDVQPRTGEFEIELTNWLDRLESSGFRLAPTFAFIDPFGFKGVPFNLIRRLLSNARTEVFVTMMADAINRFLEHPDAQQRQHIVDLFGTSKVLQVAQQTDDRIGALRQLYKEQLSQCAKYVRHFEMRDSHGRIIYYLFFAGNHDLGHKKMKEAFWCVDRNSGYRFSDATNPNQLVLFETDESPKHAAELAAELETVFSKQRVTRAQIDKYVDDKTPFIAKHTGAALKLLESEKRIQVAGVKLNNQKRRRNTFPPDAVVDFP